MRAGETTPNAKVSLLTARCLGSCSVAPVVVFDGELVGNVGGGQLQQQLNTWLPPVSAGLVEAPGAESQEEAKSIV